MAALQMQPQTISGSTPISIPFTPLDPSNMKEVPWVYPEGPVIGHVTRSGRIYQPAESQEEAEQARRKSREEAEKEEVEKQAEMEVFEKAIRKSQFYLSEHLSKVPAQISILGLLLTSEHHREELLRVLQKAYVRTDIEPERLAEVVGAVMGPKMITFTEEELPGDGTSHNKPLMITVTFDCLCIPSVLVDNGSGLNICPLRTLRTLGIAEDSLKKSPMAIKAFDNSVRQSLGDIELDIVVASAPFKLEFQVVDIKSSFTLLLGRPWLHMANAVPSSLHQRVKFFMDDELITVLADDELKLKGQVMEVQDRRPEDTYVSYQFETVSTIEEVAHLRKKMKKLPPHLNMMAIMRFDPGKGLGARGQGSKKPLKASMNRAHYGLGYEPESKQISEYQKKMEERIIYRTPHTLAAHYFQNFIKHPYPQTSLEHPPSTEPFTISHVSKFALEMLFQEEDAEEVCMINEAHFIEPADLIHPLEQSVENWYSEKPVVKSEAMLVEECQV